MKRSLLASRDGSCSPPLRGGKFQLSFPPRSGGLRFCCVFVALCCLALAWSADFDIQRFGATANDASDDTLAIRAAFEACEKAGGGRVIVSVGTYIVSRQKNESPILEVPSNTILQGEGTA
ncbi:MAG: hypothetical protein FJ388_24615, partial [Verrucomicrobia bacterium]|nr:hypothetical protein [Verrucomicrobiota bacterium]